MPTKEELTKDINKVGNRIMASHNPKVIEALQKLTVILQSWSENGRK